MKSNLCKVLNPRYQCVIINIKHSIHMATVDTQLRYMSEWFQEFSELQKSDFLPILQSQMQVAVAIAAMNGVVEHLESLNVSGNSDVNDEDSSNGDNANDHSESQGRRLPSLFQIRVNFFREWYPSWPIEIREQFLERVRELDPVFMQFLNDELGNEVNNIPAVTDNENDNDHKNNNNEDDDTN